MTDATSALRLGQPRPEAYEISGGELAVLRGMDARNLGLMGGVLLGQRADGEQRQADYARQLNRTNAQQAELGLRELAEAGRVADGKLAGTMYEHGLPATVALQMAQPGSLPIGDMGPEQARQVVIDSDGIRRAGAVAKTVRDTGAGLKDFGDAGVLVDPNQRLASPADASRLAMTTGTPIPITLRNLQEAGANARDANNGAPTTKTKYKIDPVANVPTMEFQGAGQSDDEAAARRLRRFGQIARGETPDPEPPANQTPPPGGAPTGPAGLSGAAQQLLERTAGSGATARVDPANPLAGGLPGGSRGIQPPPPGDRNAPAPAARLMTPPTGTGTPPNIQRKAQAMRNEIGDAKGYRWNPRDGWVVEGTKGKAVLGNG